jgi:hypothetical protein
MEKVPIPESHTVWEPTVTEEEIQALATRRLLRPKTEVVWRPASGEEFPTEGTGETVVFLTHIERGFGVPAGDFVTPAFLALNKSPTKSCVISKTNPASSVTIQTLAVVLSFSPRRACRDSRRHHTSAAPLRAFPTPRSATGRESRARRGPAGQSASPSPPFRN